MWFVIMKRNHFVSLSKSWWVGLFLCGSLLTGCLLSPTTKPPAPSTRGLGPCDTTADCLPGQTCKSSSCEVNIDNTIQEEQRVSLQFIPPSGYSYKKEKISKNKKIHKTHRNSEPSPNNNTSGIA